jgi:cellulase
MKFATLIPVVAAMVSTVSAHSTVYGLWVNGAFQGDGRNNYIRSPPSNTPVKDFEKTDINCNVNNRAVAKSVNVKAGDTIDIEWHHDNRGDDIIDLSHKGPVLVYIAEASSNGNGAVWTKIAHEGFSNGKWAVEKLVANGGKHSVKLPSTLAAGDYLLRAEIIAHHESDTSVYANAARGAQFYPSCSQIKVTSGGTAKPPQKFNFVGGYTRNDPGIVFNLYGADATKYKIPGPAVWDGSVTGGSPTTPVLSTTLSTVTRPSTTVVPTSTSKPVTPKPTPSTTKTSTTKPPAVTQTPGSGALVAKWSQCGGVNYKGAKQCAAGLTCKEWNPYYFQCI